MKLHDGELRKSTPLLHSPFSLNNQHLLFQLNFLEIMISMSVKSIKIKGKKITLPIYSPDATKGVIRGLDSKDLKGTGIESLVVNPYHLATQPGISVIKKHGGIKKFYKVEPEIEHAATLDHIVAVTAS